MMQSGELELVWNDSAERATFAVFWSFKNLGRLMLFDSRACWYAVDYTLGCYAAARRPHDNSELESPNHHRWRKGHLRVCAEHC